MGNWHFWVDRGGTFTDVVARTPDGEMVTAKLLSEDPERYDDAAVAAIRMLTECPSGPLPPIPSVMQPGVKRTGLINNLI